MRGASWAIELLILLIVASPILGSVTPQVAPKSELGLGVDLQSINSQLQFLSSSSTIAGSHSISVPAFNKWVLPAKISLSLSLLVNGTAVYTTPASSISLGPFQSGTVDITMDIPQNAISQMEGHTVSGGGQMTLQEAGLWAISINLA